ncbi:hypothetical protein [uncultured Vibrio sp.]|uniref:hypothetical protein n=1 Tax=uncultured Vibrio sp. TaxID=114054 RepID=UPI0009156741|nr:hypothetical protein [uncultured Vibrio sp.]OIQ26561.1 MAG: hypothetical protein BM561_02070 [Vibrio sp. MedPE-SWchi]
MSDINKQLLLCAIAVILIVLNVGAHVLGAKMFVDLPLSEITVGSVPAIGILLCIIGFKIAEAD